MQKYDGFDIFVGRFRYKPILKRSFTQSDTLFYHFGMAATKNNPTFVA